jgi:hypothetical protein
MPCIQNLHFFFPPRKFMTEAKIADAAIAFRTDETRESRPLPKHRYEKSFSAYWGKSVTLAGASL